MSRKCFCLSCDSIYLLQNYFSSYKYVKDIYKTLKKTGNIQFVSESKDLRNLQIYKFHGSLHKEKNRNY